MVSCMKMSVLVVFLVMTGGCVSQPPAPGEIMYLEIPEGYLQLCTLPELPADNSDLSDAFAQAYACAEIGNADKLSIRQLGVHSIEP